MITKKLINAYQVILAVNMNFVGERCYYSLNKSVSTATVPLGDEQSCFIITSIHIDTYQVFGNTIPSNKSEC